MRRLAPGGSLPSLALALAVAVALTGCGGAVAPADAEGPADDPVNAPAAAPNDACPPPNVEIAGALDIIAECRRMIALADARLGLMHWPVTDVTLRWSLCPPNARCLFMQFRQAWVVYRFLVGEPAMIHIRPSEPMGAVMVSEYVADAPEPVPDWLIEQIERGEAASLDELPS